MRETNAPTPNAPPRLWLRRGTALRGERSRLVRVARVKRAAAGT